MNGRQAKLSRVARKARRVAQTDLDRELNTGLARLRADRDTAHHDANRAFEKAVDELRDVRRKAHTAADQAHEDARAALIKKLAAKERRKEKAA